MSVKDIIRAIENMSTMDFIMCASLATITIGLIINLKAIEKYREIRKHEFNNRNDFGVVKFKDFETAERFKSYKGTIIFRRVAGFYLMIFGALVFIFCNLFGQ